MVSNPTAQNNFRARRIFKTRHSQDATSPNTGLVENLQDNTRRRFKRTYYVKKRNSRNNLHIHDKSKKQIVIKKNMSDFIILPVSLIISIFMFFVYDDPLNYIFCFAALIPIIVITYFMLLSNHVKNIFKKTIDVKSNRFKIFQRG